MKEVNFIMLLDARGREVMINTNAITYIQGNEITLTNGEVIELDKNSLDYLKDKIKENGKGKSKK